jgi:four helix bundle protein
MAVIEKFEDLEVWKAARHLVNNIYKSTGKDPFSRDWGLKDQIQRAAVSIMSNIAEGYERGSNKEFIQFLFISKASAAEVRSLLFVAFDQNYIDKNKFEELSAVAISISKQLKGFISYLEVSKLKKRFPSEH